MRIYKSKQGVYYLAYKTQFGFRYLSTRSKNQEEATRLVTLAGAEEIESAARANALSAAMVARIVTGKNLKMEEAGMRFIEWMQRRTYSVMTIDIYKHHIFFFCRNHPHYHPTEITEETISLWVNNPRSTLVADSRWKQLCVLKTFFKWGIDSGICFCNPASLVDVDYSLLTHAQKEPREKIPFTDDEVKKLLTVTPLGTFWHSATAIGRFAGLRIRDIANLETDCLKKPDRIIVWTSKTDRRVEIPIEHEELDKAIKAIPIVADRYLFPLQQSIASFPHTKAQLSFHFTRLCKRNGIEGKSFHCLRHAFATADAKQGRTWPEIAARLGHAHPSTSAIYVH